MDPNEINMEEILSKWETHHPPPQKKTTDEKPWYEQSLREHGNINPRRRESRRYLKKVNSEFMNQNVYLQRKFRVLPPNLRADIQNYEVSQCMKCKTRLEYFPVESKDALHSQSLNLFDHVANKKGMRFYGSSFLKSMVLNACYQSKDELLLKQVNKKKIPLLYVHNAPCIFTSVLLYLYTATFGKPPYVVVQGDHVRLPLLKYMMKKLGFLFIGVDDDIKDNVVAAERISGLLKSNNHVLIGIGESEVTSSLGDRLFPHVLQELRKDGDLMKTLLLQPITLSIERISTLFTTSSLIEFLQEWSHFSSIVKGVVQFNLSLGVKLKSLMSSASELNEQDGYNEEDNLILRHISYDLLETCAILPTNLVAFLLMIKFHDTVSIDELTDAVEWLLNELRNSGRFLGFTGKTADVTNHALRLLHDRDLIEINFKTTTVSRKIQCCKSLQTLFKQSLIIIHAFVLRGILASSIIACLGGHNTMRQGSGYNVRCSNDKMLLKAEYIADLLSFLFDYCCPFNKISGDLIDSIEKLVTMEILSRDVDTYDNQTHEKLVRSEAINSMLDMEDDDYHVTQAENEVFYDVLLQDDGIQMLSFLSSCITPFIELTFVIVAIIKEYEPDRQFNVSTIHDALMKRFNDGLFVYGEVITLNYISRVCDFLYEKVYIDEAEHGFQISSSLTTGNSEVVKLLSELAQYREHVKCI